MPSAARVMPATMSGVSRDLSKGGFPEMSIVVHRISRVLPHRDRGRAGEDHDHAEEHFGNALDGIEQPF
jgi:hypothetical protein